MHNASTLKLKQLSGIQPSFNFMNFTSDFPTLAKCLHIERVHVKCGFLCDQECDIAVFGQKVNKSLPRVM